MLISKGHLLSAGISTRNVDIYYNYVLKYFQEYQINTKERIISFLSNVLHECNYFNGIVENMNYSESGLLEVFRKYFTPEQAKAYARKPEAIGSRVYANRMGNGNEASKEGYKFRGRGGIHVTGKNNYSNLSKYIGVDLVKNPDLVLLPDMVIKSALWFWSINNLNSWADKITTAKTEAEKTKYYKSIASIINTGSPNNTPIHWNDREKNRKKLEKIIL